MSFSVYKSGTKQEVIAAVEATNFWEHHTEKAFILQGLAQLSDDEGKGVKIEASGHSYTGHYQVSIIIVPIILTVEPEVPATPQD